MVFSTKNCIIPKGTRIVILNKPPKEATAFHFMCITTKRLNKKLLPDLKQMEMRKEGFGITIFIETFFNYFKLDKNQKIEFTQSAA